MKNKKKLKKTIIILSVIIVSLIGIGTVSFYMIGDYIFKSILESYVEKQINSGIEDIIKDIEVGQELVEKQQTVQQGELKEDKGSTTEGEKEQIDPNTASKIGLTKSNGEAMTKEEVKVAVNEKVKEVSKDVPVKDKINMTSIILKNLSQEDISYLTSLIIDGISSSDLAEAKAIARSRFTKEEIEEIYIYYQKYQDMLYK